MEYWRDMSISPKILEQSSESLRKIRNSARFILGNIGDAGTRAEFECVPKDRLGLVSRGESTTLERGLIVHRLIATSCMNCSSLSKLR